MTSRLLTLPLSPRKKGAKQERSSSSFAIEGPGKVYQLSKFNIDSLKLLVNGCCSLRVERLASLSIFFAVLTAFPLQGASHTPVRGENGMVVSADAFASRVGIETLKRGGNAVDAAVAVGFALAVTHPAAGNLGGGGFMMIRLGRGQTICIDYRERAPLGANENSYLDSAGELIPKASTQGCRASGVPGTVAGLCYALNRYGSLPLREVIQPAIDLAEKGFPVSYHLSQSLKNSSLLLQSFPESARIYLRDRKYFEPGETLVLTDLAWSLKMIRDSGAESFYEGPIAQKIDNAFKVCGTWITKEDLRSYRPILRVPITGSYRNYEVITVPPPSSGGIVLLEMLNILEGYKLGDLGAGSSREVHLVTEAMRRAFRDRAELLGDPDFVKIPVTQLISKRYAARLRESILPDKASSSRLLSSRDLPTESQETTHFSVVDSQGNAVANTYTLNGSYGSGLTIPGTGILMNNEMDDFTIKGGMANVYGLVQAQANAIAPGKRPLSAMTPSFVTKDGKLFLVIGSPGGPTIINTVLEVILNVIDFGFTIQEAIDAPRFHHQYFPDELRLEKQGWVRDVITALENRGHTTVLRGFMGDAQGIQLDLQTGILWGASDPRGDGLAVGY